MRRSDCWYISACSREDCTACIRYQEMSYLMDSSGIPKNRQYPKPLYPAKCDYAAFKRLAEIKENIVEFVKQGLNLYITSSSTGNGKTSWAIKLMCKYFDSIWAGNGFRCRGLFIHVPTFLVKSKDFHNQSAEFQQFRNSILDADLVVWDDIASTDISAYDYSQLLMYIDGRVTDGKSNIYTGNITQRDVLEKSLGGKLTSRILSADTEKIEFLGGDKR